MAIYNSVSDAQVDLDACETSAGHRASRSRHARIAHHSCLGRSQQGSSRRGFGLDSGEIRAQSRARARAPTWTPSKRSARLPPPASRLPVSRRTDRPTTAALGAPNKALAMSLQLGIRRGRRKRRHARRSASTWAPAGVLRAKDLPVLATLGPTTADLGAANKAARDEASVWSPMCLSCSTVAVLNEMPSEGFLGEPVPRLGQHHGPGLALWVVNPAALVKQIEQVPVHAFPSPNLAVVGERG
jgi:hypothetical protein